MDGIAGVLYYEVYRRVQMLILSSELRYAGAGAGLVRDLLTREVCT